MISFSVLAKLNRFKLALFPPVLLIFIMVFIAWLVWLHDMISLIVRRLNRSDAVMVKQTRCFSRLQVSPDGVSDGMEGLTMTSKYKRVWEHFLSASSLSCHCWIKAWWRLRLSSGPLIRKLPRWACPSCWATATWRRRRRPPTTTPPVRPRLSQLYQCGQIKQISECLERWSSEGSPASVDIGVLLFLQASHQNRRAPLPRRTWTSWSKVDVFGAFTNTSFFQKHSIDGFVLMFRPNFYLFLSVEVLVLAVFLCLSLWETFELLANLANAPKEAGEVLSMFVLMKRTMWRAVGSAGKFVPVFIILNPQTYNFDNPGSNCPPKPKWC